MTSLYLLPVEEIVQRYPDELALVHRDLLDSFDETAEGLNKINKADAGDHPGNVLAPVLRRHLAPLLREDLEGMNMSLYTVQFDGLRLRFLVDGRVDAIAKLRKRKLDWTPIPEAEFPLTLFPEDRPGSLAILWEMSSGHVRSVALARVDDQSWEDVLGVYEEAPLPPPAAKTYPPPPGTSNDDDDLGGIVRPRRDDDDDDDLGGIVSKRDL